MKVAGFLGPSNRSRAFSSDCEQTINLLAELQQAGTPKDSPVMLKRPALRPWAKLPAGPVRGLYEVNGNAVAVGGNQFCILTPNRTVQVVGEVAVDSHPATFAWNGQQGGQILVTSGRLGYVFDQPTADFNQITDPSFPENVAACEYLANTGIVRIHDSNIFYYSQENDFTDWNSLDQFATSLTADNKTGLIANHGELLLAGVNRSEFWAPTGNLNTPFAPVGASMVEQGTCAGYSLQRLDNAVFLVQGDERGSRMVIRTSGYNFQRISTNALEFYLNSLDLWQIQQINGWTAQMDGHALYGLNIPNAPFTPVYDVSTQMWFDWAHWDNVMLVWRQFRCRNHIFVFGKHLVGSPIDGVIYEMAFAPLNDPTFEADAVVIP